MATIIKRVAIFLAITSAYLTPVHLYADTPEEAIQLIKQQYYRNKMNDSTLQLKDQIALVDTMLMYATDANIPKELIPLYIQKANLEFQDNAFNTAYTLYDSVIANISRYNLVNQYSNELIEAYLQQGRISYILGKYATGIYYMYELLKHDMHIPQVAQIQAYTQLGKLYMRMQKNNLALNNLDEAQKILERLPASEDSIRQQLEYDILIAESSVYIQKQDIDKSLSYIEKAREISDGINQFKLYQNLSILNLQINELDIAIDYCNKALDDAPTAYERSVVLNNYAIMCFLAKKYDQALSLCEQNLVEIEKIDAAHVKSNLYSIFSRIHSAKGNFEEALKYREQEQQVLDSIFNKESEERIMQLNSEFESEKIKHDKELLEYRLKLAELENFRKITLIILLIILCVGILLFVIYTKKKSSKEKESLKQQLITLDENKNELIRSTSEGYENIIGQKSRELTSSTMYMAKMSEIAVEIQNLLNNLQPYCTEENSKNILQEIQSKTTSLTSEKYAWEDFKLQFEQIHPSFFARLNEAHPNITLSEIKMCAFITMNLNTKEIAAITNRSIRTVETTKFRLRKKLGLQNETSTISYLRQFIDSSSAQSSAHGNEISNT